MMIPGVTWGVGRDLDSEQAARQAVQNALDRMGSARPSFAIVFFTREYVPAEIMRGLRSYLANVPIWGFCTSAPLNAEGELPRSVLLAIVGGIRRNANAAWVDASKLELSALENLIDNNTTGVILAGNRAQNCFDSVFGWVHTHQVETSGMISVTGDDEQSAVLMGGVAPQKAGFSILALKKSLRMGAASASGWISTGLEMNITRSHQERLDELDGQPAVQVLAEKLGIPANQLLTSPLRKMIRLYAFDTGQNKDNEQSQIYAPVGIIDDKSLIFDRAISAGMKTQLKIGNIEACIDAAEKAAETALSKLGNARPLIVMVLVDQAWQYLFSGLPGSFMKKIGERVGDIPLIGAYTHDQVIRTSAHREVQINSQCLQVTIIGEETG